MTSNIDPTVPATAGDLNSAPVRNNFAAARTEILALQTQVAAIPGGPQGPAGPPGTAATVTVGTTTTGSPGTNAAVNNSGSTSAAVFNFTIPRGDVGAAGSQGPAGAAATATAGTTSTGAPGTNAIVTNVGTTAAAVFNFTIPRGDVGPQGPPGASGSGTGTINSGSAPALAQYVGASSTTVGPATVSGDATLASGGALALATVNSNVGTFQGLTVNAKGLVTAAVNQSYLTGNQTVTLSGDVTGSGATAITTALKTDVALAGNPTTTTQATADSSTRIATTAFVKAQGTIPAAANPTATVSGTATNGIAATFMRSDAAPALGNTTVVAASYTYASITVDAQGRLTAASNGTAPPAAANPTATVSGTAVNGSATTYMRSDAAPALGPLGTAGTYNNPTQIVTDATGRVSSVTGGNPPPGLASVAWLSGSNPGGACIFCNNTGRTLTVQAITGVVETAAGGTATVDIKKGVSGAALSGSNLNTTQFNANAAVGTTTSMLSTPFTLANTERLGLVCTTWPASPTSIASITVYLV